MNRFHASTLFAAMLCVVSVNARAGEDIKALQLAKRGDAIAQYNLAAMYEHGDGVEQDDKNAIYWYTKSAEQGNAEAQIKLGFTYETGEGGLAQDYKQAIQWYTKAAESGHAYAQFVLAEKYRKGDIVAKDDKKALQWYTKAAEQGIDYAQLALGYQYAHGEGGLPQDYKQAIRWYTKAAEQGNSYGQLKLGDLYCLEGETQDYKQAVQWYTKAANGNIEAQIKLAAMYDNGQGVNRSRVVAYALHNYLASKNFASKEEYSDNRDKVAKNMNSQEIEAGQELTQQMLKQGNLIEALDNYNRKAN